LGFSQISALLSLSSSDHRITLVILDLCDPGLQIDGMADVQISQYQTLYQTDILLVCLPP